jgi:hypothetical protein
LAKDWRRIGEVVDKVAAKGAKDAYIAYGEQGFIVNIPSRTVVTTLTHGGETVVTNIDSVAIVSRLDQSGGLAAGIDGTAAHRGPGHTPMKE